MMTDLTSLIRVRKHAVEEKQKIVAELYQRAEALENEKTDILGKLAEEESKAHKMGVEMLSYLGPYARAVEDRVKEIDAATKTLESRIEVAQDDMRLAFSELKKVEITQEKRMAEEVKTLNKKEADTLDEIAIDIFRRNQEES